MRRRISTTQLRSKLNQVASRRRQAINKYNQAVRRYNQNVRSSVSRYNQAVRTHNARVRAHRQRIDSALSRPRTQTSKPRYRSFQTSAHSLHEAYIRLEARSGAESASPRHDLLVDLSGRETANSLEVMNALLGTPILEDGVDDLQETTISDELARISPDLDERWRGALFSLNQRNPEAARHFCTSAREIFGHVFDLRAPSERVLSAFPDCQKTPQGTPTRRARIKFFLHNRALEDRDLEEFVERDIDNIVELFELFNAGTHGPTGKFALPRLHSIKKRVEDGLIFLSSLVS